MKNIKKLRLAAAVLLCFALIAMFVACNDEKDKEKTGTSTDLKNTENQDPDNTDPNAPYIPGYSGIDKIDMNGKIFTALLGSWGDTILDKGGSYADIAYVEESTGDPVDDASYDRRVKLETMYNCKIRAAYELSGNVNPKYLASILADDQAYDFAFTFCTSFDALLLGSNLVDWSMISNVDMDKPYWSSNFYEAMSILGRHYGADGDISKRRLECVWIMAFNKKMIADYGFDSPFDLVKDGKWTYDKMHEMAKQVGRKLDGDGEMTADDQWGINYTGDSIMGIINCSGVKFADKDKDGMPYITINDELNMQRLPKIYETMKDNNYSIDTLFGFPKLGFTSGIIDTFIFGEGRCLFLACAGHNINGHDGTNLRTTDVDFGIIPYPKWDESQDYYISMTDGGYHPVLTVPQSNRDLENTGILLEAMAYEGMKYITPAFYDNILMIKTVRDEQSAEMIEYLYGNITYDVGNMFNFGNMLGTFGSTMSRDARANISSLIEKNKNAWQRALDKLIDEVEKAS